MPAGSFKCFIIESSSLEKRELTKTGGDSRTARTYWFAPGVGIVKSEATLENQFLLRGRIKKATTGLREELTDFKVR